MFVQQALFQLSLLPSLKIIKTFRKAKADWEAKHPVPPERKALYAVLSRPQGPALPEALHDILAGALGHPAGSILQTHYVSPPCRAVLRHRPVPPLPMSTRFPC